MAYRNYNSGASITTKSSFISSSIIASLSTNVSNTTESSSGSSGLGASSASDYNSSLGIELTMSITPGTISEGGGVSMYLSLANTLTTQNNLALPGGVRNPPSLGGCSPLPFGVSIFEGNYDVGNLSQGKSFGLLGPNTDVVCPGYPYYFSMPPTSSEMFFASFNESIPAATNMTYWGYWSYHDGDVFRPFSPGIYTMEGEDWWGQATLLHFRVVQNQNPFDCATIATNSSFVAYTNVSSSPFVTYTIGATSQGPLKLDAYYLNPPMNDTLVLALSNPGNSTLEIFDTASVGFVYAPYIFSPNASEVQSWQYYAPNGTIGFPAVFYPDQCALVRLALSTPWMEVPLTMYFTDNQTQTMTFNP